MVQIANPNWVETLDALIDDDIFPRLMHRIHLHGLPGTGKSSYAQYRFGVDRVERVPIHKQLPPEDLIGTPQLSGDGHGATVTTWHDGPAIRAMREGKILVLDEIDQISHAVRCMMHAIMDDRSMSGIVLPNGEIVRPAPGFGIIATSNPAPSALPTAIRDRFDFVIAADCAAPGILAILDISEARVLDRHYAEIAARSSNEWSVSLATITNRRMISFCNLRKVWDRERAAQMIFGDGWQDMLTLIAAQTDEVLKS